MNLAQSTLLDEKYDFHQFPKTQYLGSKEKLIPWILAHIPNDVNTVLDAFSGSSVVGYYLKDNNYQVYSNDFLKCNSLIAKALIANQDQRLTQNDLAIIFAIYIFV